MSQERQDNGDKPFFQVRYRSQDEELPPSAITEKDCPIWFKQPKYFFGQHLIEIKKEGKAQLDGWVIGMQWDEQQWSYSILDREMGMIWDAIEDEVILYPITT